MSSCGLVSFDQAEIFCKMIQRGQHRIRRHAAHRAQRTVQHRIAQVAQQLDLRGSVLTGDDLVTDVARIVGEAETVNGNGNGNGNDGEEEPGSTPEASDPAEGA